MARQASAQSVYGYSALYLTPSLVYSNSLTDLNYAAQAYYSVQTDAYLWVGNSYSSASTTTNNGTISLYSSTAINTNYAIQTNHWVVPAAGGSVPNFSCVTPYWYTGSFDVSACGWTTSPTTLYVGTSTVSGNTDGGAPLITGVDQTTYGTAAAGTGGYVILYGSGNNLSYPWTTTSAVLHAGV